MKKDPKGGKAEVPYVPTPEERRLAIPEIACQLWYYSKGMAMLHTMMPEDADPDEDFLYARLSRLNRRYTELLVYCGLERLRVVEWARMAWRRGKAGYVPWFEWPKEAEELLAQLGYTLGEEQPNGYTPPDAKFKKKKSKVVPDEEE